MFPRSNADRQRRRTPAHGWCRAAAVAAIAALCLCTTAAPSALAEPPAADVPPSSETSDKAEATPDDAHTIKSGVLPGLVATVPGLLAPGLGHLVAGDRTTAMRLLKLRGLAFAAVLVSGGAFVATNGSRYMARPVIPILVGSLSVFFAGWGADIYGASGGPRLSGVAVTEVAELEARLGYQYVVDPRFRYTSFTDIGADYRRAEWRGSERAQLAVPADN
ncbi:MAG: hypothetical protein AAGC55_08920, partial [Myxococcota bacterium]